MKSSSYQFIFVIIHVVTSSHFICLISATCSIPDPIPNTITTLPNQTLDTGSYITWECSDGYMMDGLKNTAVWVCLEDGCWLSHTPILCKAIKCPSPPIAAYSKLAPSTEAPVVNQTIAYSCSGSEYTLLGSNLNRCLQDGTWENDPPVCQRTCSSNGTVRYSSLTCYETYETYFGNWDDSFNLCIDQAEILATVKDAQTQEFLVEFIMRLEANIWIGAREGRDWKWRKTDKYVESFFWRNPFPDSNPGDCIELSYQSGSAKYSWNPRSFQEENALLCQYDQSCQSVGLKQSSMVLEYLTTCFQFLDAPMSCANGARECERRGGFLAEIIDESTNALLVDQALFLRNNKFVGEDTAWWIGGFDDDNNERSWYWSDQTRMIFEAWQIIQPNGIGDHCVEMRFENNYQYEWNDRPCSEGKRALCQIGIPACGDPGEPFHGNRLPDDRTTYSVNATLHFTCQEGYTLSGESVLRCMNNGAWNHQRPSCEAVECEGSAPEVALASTMIQGSVYQDIALYNCQDGYIPANEPISFCQHTGTWSTPNFTCLEIGLTTPITCTTQASPQGTESKTAIAAGSVVAILFILVVTVLTVILFKRRRAAKPVLPDDENEMENYAADADCYEEIKIEADSDQRGAFGTQRDQPSVISGNRRIISKPTPYYSTKVADIPLNHTDINESAIAKSEGKGFGSSPQYENSAFDQSQTDVHTYQELKKPDQETNYDELNDDIKRDYINVPSV